MKLNLVFLFIIYVCISLANCGIQTINNAVHKDHPGKCYIPTTPPTILSPGDTATLAGKCERAICDRKLNVEIHSCGDLPEPKGCKKTQNAANRPYPECCPKLKCN